MRVLVCGGRDFNDESLVMKTLDQIDRQHGIVEIVHGAARGADSLAGKWADTRFRTVTEFPANWQAHGKAAGPIRNQEMLGHTPDLVVAFPGGRGTADMVRRAKAEGILVFEVI